MARRELIAPLIGVAAAAPLAIWLSGFMVDDALISARYAALILLSLTLVIAAFWLSPKMQAMRPEIVHLAVDHPDRLLFGKYHDYSVLLGKLGLLFGLIALYFS